MQLWTLPFLKIITFRLVSSLNLRASYMHILVWWRYHGCYLTLKSCVLRYREKKKKNNYNWRIPDGIEHFSCITKKQKFVKYHDWSYLQVRDSPEWLCKEFKFVLAYQFKNIVRKLNIHKINFQCTSICGHTSCVLPFVLKSSILVLYLNIPREVLSSALMGFEQCCWCIGSLSQFVYKTSKVFPRRRKTANLTSLKTQYPLIVQVHRQWTIIRECSLCQNSWKTRGYI